MPHYLLLTTQIIVLIIAGILLWQIWHFLKRKDIPQEEPLGKQRAKYLTRRLTALSVCAVIEAALAITQAVLRFIEGL
jgi:membrane protein implicated in regulation of membrane protease activity